MQGLGIARLTLEGDREFGHLRVRQTPGMADCYDLAQLRVEPCCLIRVQ
jgi:hypothetical protein